MTSDYSYEIILTIGLWQRQAMLACRIFLANLTLFDVSAEPFPRKLPQVKNN